MSEALLSLSDVATKLQGWASAAATSRDRANDPDSIRKFDALFGQYHILAESVLAASRQPRPRHSVRRLGGLTAQAFWALAGDAQRAILDVYGPRWAILAPIGETVLATVPSGWRSYVGVRGGTIRYRADHRLPGPMFWPGGVLPAGLILSPEPPREDQAVARKAYLKQLERCR